MENNNLLELKEGLKEVAKETSELKGAARELRLACSTLAESMKRLEEQQGTILDCHSQLKYLVESIKGDKEENKDAHDEVFKRLRCLETLRSNERLESLETSRWWLVVVIIGAIIAEAIRFLFRLET